ncbi:MAG: SLC13 family permease [Chloroflexota bacterium]|jgi:di/tricarboxylate transporter
MTIDIALVLAILAAAVVLFVTERIKMEVVALLVLVALAVTGLVTPAEALSGFSNPAVITVLAMFIIGGGLSRTGVANLIGRQIMRLAGEGEGRLIAIIMITAAVMSAFMNNVGVAAMMLPVVMDLARRTGNSPSRLLLPLAFGSLLGGTLTLIGTPTNLLISDALRENGLTPFGLFDFTPIGTILTIGGVLYMVVLGRRLLPTRIPAAKAGEGKDTDLGDVYDLQEHLSILRIPEDSLLAGKNLVQSRLGTGLQVNVVAILRNGQTELAPTPEAVLRGGDRLVVQGRSDSLEDLRRLQYQSVEEEALTVNRLVGDDIGVVEASLSPRSDLLGQSLFESDLRHKLGVTVLAIQSREALRRTNFQNISLRADDRLIMLGDREQLAGLKEHEYFNHVRPVDADELTNVYQLDKRFLALQVMPESALAGRSLAESRLGDAWGLSVLAIQRNGETRIMPDSGEMVQPHDTLLVQGRTEDLQTLRGLQTLELEPQSPADLAALESAKVGLAEVVLSPHSRLVGQSLRRINFREKYDLSVVAIWRGGEAYRTNLRDMPLQLGDALLVYGTRNKVNQLGSEPDFLVLTEAAQEPLRLEKAPIAALIMLAVLIPVVMEWLPIAITGLMGATLMMLFGCVTVEEAYRFIDLKGIFLIAGMLPLGIAMEQTGAAALVAEVVIGSLDSYGPYAVIIGIFLLTTVATQFIPSAAVAVLMSSIALSSAASLNLSPYSLMMLVAMATCGTFLSPISHPANVMVMGPGGYRFSDFTRVGLLLSLVMLILLLIFLPIFWPL